MVVLAHAPSGEPAPLLALLVDRDEDTREMYRAFLKNAAFDVEETADGRQALAVAINRRPDVIVTDTHLVGVSGYDLCGLLRRDPITSDTPIVVVTGHAATSELARAHEAGADTVLVKPCLPDILLLEMRRLIERSKELRRHGQQLRSRVADEISRSQRLHEKIQSTRRTALSHAFKRHDSVAPPSPPPALVCPACDRSLVYQRSHIGGVNEHHTEQWDYFECPSGCGTFQYRQRTRKIRKVD